MISAIPGFYNLETNAKRGQFYSEVYYNIDGKNIAYPVTNIPFNIVNTSPQVVGSEGVNATGVAGTGFDFADTDSDAGKEFGGHDMAKIQKLIQKNVSQLTRDKDINISQKMAALQQDDGIIKINNFDFLTDPDTQMPIFDKEVVYIKDRNLVFENAGSAIKITKPLTIIVEGGNIIIKDNIIKSNPNALLGIISLERNNKGGNVLIHPDVTKIDMVSYLEGALLPYATTSDANINHISSLEEIVGFVQNSNSLHTVSEVNRTLQLANQLQITGFIVALENTINGAEKDIPYEGNQEINITMDLFHARTYRIGSDGNPMHNGQRTEIYDKNGDPTGTYIDSASPLIINNDPKFLQQPLKGFELPSEFKTQTLR